ncbi:proteasome subunit beta type-3 isoform X3 [Aegilops tauschii subsp. strangulata]|uniref:proteasome subunit beta type-3 isoform X3 n=1 Tax=Aegilops tauschii subsp. strangulata TaxID=200361 RepID=UPI00098A70DD|nr:proteasome subunit beta type-3 isoform X4 [Aegilops tauschii subsp. strangulata]XP_020148895.1 proteasome subunit beta type-3 isoform X4 [Aegilops tauschii subsp. strangulata]XP_020148896.1 proteasome subunit beta type-3 isoform X4 [Aegilops tauschii subsp. strangulata]
MAMAMTSLQDVLQQIFEYNGSPVVEMVGKNCFAIASDYHLGVQLQTIATDFQRAFKIHGKLYISLSGLTTDAQTLQHGDSSAAHALFLSVRNLDMVFSQLRY